MIREIKVTDTLWSQFAKLFSHGQHVNFPSLIHLFKFMGSVLFIL